MNANRKLTFALFHLPMALALLFAGCETGTDGRQHLTAGAIKPNKVFPPGWADLLAVAPTALGLDVATTEKDTSNPSSLAITQKLGVDFIVRLLLRWKTRDPRVTQAILDLAIDGICARGIRPRGLAIDATNERFFATTERTRLAGRLPVDLVISSETLEIQGEPVTYKVYLGNLLINTLNDARLALPNADWVKADFRLVKHDRGSFTAEVDADGNHADSFESVKLSLHELTGAGGPVTASAASVGTFGAPAPQRPGIRNPFARFFN